MYKVLTTIVLLISSMFTVQAASVSPYQTLETTGNSLFNRIAQQQQELAKFPDLMRTIVEEELMPHVDYKYAAFRILGKQLKKTTKEERNKFADAMRHYLVRTYATALASYTDQQVIYEPEKSFEGKRVVAVSTRIIDKDAPEIEIQFKMRRNKKTGQWKAFDMVVEGISLLESKKAELNRKIQQQGLSQVTLELASIAK
ncbi:MlaC/ttg2D family ABC transporter substrate-binding protein [Thalassotalea euphylliae]|uniref:ABC transporter substrate-binding protein n=1 Tax=Thalassotalea euphylliae TaxID=1655234 RepID=A0A3E0TZG4_9GAMM|nr:ABC transporter substrate-binding protein [Thalassotalea euphylliae]REL30038.1 ABC transporter substrate-binding protein [Thalassotalea euphylliae]